MAEFVNQRIEEMIPELEQMKRIELYTPEEIKEISKKRKEFEYKIRRQVRCKDDFLNYVAYECLLLQNIRLRREKYMIDEQKDDIEYTISKRVSKLFKEMITRFPNDLEVWLNFMTFCKNVKFLSTITSYLEKLVQVHGDKPKIWQLAAKWEYEEMNNIVNARIFLLKGIHRFPKFEQFYLDAVRIELLVAQAIKDEDRSQQIMRAEVIFNNATDQCKNVKFMIAMHSVFDNFDFTSSFSEKICRILWDSYFNEVETWSFIAKRELEGKDVTGFDWRSISTELFMNCDPKVINFINVYETGLQKSDAKNLCINYINSAMKLITTEDTNIPAKLQILNIAFQKGHQLKQLKEEHYKIWLNLMFMDNTVNKGEIEEILKTACSILPTSCYIWEERLKRVSDNDDEFLKVFKLAKSRVKTENVDSIWQLAIANAKNLDKIRKLRNESMSLYPSTASKIKPLFLKAFYDYGNIEIVRFEYVEMARTPPLVKELHDAMIEIERSQIVPDPSFLKNCHERATQQFGKSNIDVWLDYIKFEIGNGHPERCGLLYTRACSNLDENVIGRFISKYSLIKSEV